MNQAIIIAVLALVGGGAAAALIAGLFQRPKSRAETNKLVAEAGASLDQRWKSWAEELEERLTNQARTHSEEMLKLTLKVTEVSEGLEREKARVVKLTADIAYEKRVTRAMVQWSLRLREEIERLKGEVPDAPRSVEDYLLSLDHHPLHTFEDLDNSD